MIKRISKVAKQVQAEIESYLEQKTLIDNAINLSQSEQGGVEQLSMGNEYASEGYMTLLSEGVVLYPSGQIRLYLTKGTLKDWYNGLDDDYEGYITVGHVDLNSFPVRQGYFTKKDLRIVEDENGRADLLVRPRVNLEMSQIRDLILQDEPFAISSEFLWSPKAISEDEEEEFAKLAVYQAMFSEEPVPITDKVDILGFSFVGNPGNAKSGGYDPSILLQSSKETKLNKDKTLDKILAHFNGTSPVVEPEVVEEALAVVEQEEAEVAEVVEAVEEAVEEQAEEAKDEVAELLQKATEKIEELTAKLEALEAEKAELASQVEAHNKKESAVEERMATLSALLSRGSVVAPVVEEKKEELASQGFRKRFGGK